MADFLSHFIHCIEIDQPTIALVTSLGSKAAVLSELPILLVVKGCADAVLLANAIVFPKRINIKKGIIACIGIAVPTLGVIRNGSGALRIGTQESPLGSGMVASNEVIEIGLGIAFFLG
jgi:hypothetical protein